MDWGNVEKHVCSSGRHSIPTDIDICVACWTFEVHLLGNQEPEDDSWGAPSENMYACQMAGWIPVDLTGVEPQRQLG